MYQIGLENLEALNRHVETIFNSYNILDSKNSLEYLASERHVKVEDLIDIQDITLSESDKRYIKTLRDAKNTVEKMNKNSQNMQED